MGLSVPHFGPEPDIYRQMAVTFTVDIHSPQRMNHSDVDGKT